MKNPLIYFLSLMVICSCNEKTEPEVDSLGASRDSAILARGIDIEPDILLADSMEVIYYSKTEDSLQYERYFTYTTASDTNSLNLVKLQMQAEFVVSGEVRKCRSDGKIHLFHRAEPVKVIYYSGGSGACRYVYFIRNGDFYYFELDQPLEKFLNENRINAVRP